MKKTIFTLTIIALFSISTFAQMEIKPTIGANFSKLSDEPESFNQSARVGYQLGGSLQFGKKLYWEPGIFWVQSGSELVHADDSDINYNMDISSMRIPVFVGYQIIGGDDINIFGLRVFGGPTGSWVTNVKVDNTKLDKEDFSNFIWGVDAGVGVDVWLLFLDIGYEWGLTQVYKNDPDKAKNNIFWVNFGARFRIGG